MSRAARSGAPGGWPADCGRSCVMALSTSAYSWPRSQGPLPMQAAASRHKERCWRDAGSRVRARLQSKAGADGRGRIGSAVMTGTNGVTVRAVRPHEYALAGELLVEAYRTLADAGDPAYER